MDNKISRLDSIKEYFRDLKIYSKDSIHEFIRHKVKIGYKASPNHEFMPDQSKLGMHLAILDPDNLMVEDIMTTDPKFGGMLKLRPIFVEISHEDKSKITFGDNPRWVYNPDDKTFVQLENIAIEEKS